MARYVVGEELKQLYERGATIQRDTQAGVNVGQKNKRTQDLEDSVGRAWTEESEERARAGETSTDTAPTVAIEHVEVSFEHYQYTMDFRLMGNSLIVLFNSWTLCYHPNSTSNVPLEDKIPRREMKRLENKPFATT